MTLDTQNRQAVTRRTDGKLLVQAPAVCMTPAEAVSHAAWLVMLASLDLPNAEELFAETYAAIRASETCRPFTEPPAEAKAKGGA